MDDFRTFIDELLAKTDIVQVISRYVPLQRKGNTHWCCCPFHHEKDPSFSISEAKQFFYCYGCKQGGNAITFVQKIESVDFMDAVRMLAEQARMEVPTFRGGGDGEKTREKRRRLCALMKDVARHYHDNLSLPEAAVARDYLESRGVDLRLVTKFGLGYSTDGNRAVEFLAKKGYTVAEMKEAGVVDLRGDRSYDVFYGRLMFPIIDNFGSVVAFGGRTLKADYEFAKYRNSSQTPIFDKSKNIYGVNLLKKKKQRENIDSVIMTEGYMDVIALHKGGFDTAVASMGTALTTAQARILKNYADKVYISYDGDFAGQKATMRGLDILADAGLKVRVVELPEGLDPDDVIKRHGAAAYKQLIDEAVTLTEFKIKTLRKQHDFSDPDGKSAFAVEAVKVIKALKNPVEREEYLELVRSYTGYSKQVLMKQAELTFDDEREPAPPKREEPAPKQMTNCERAALFVLASLADGKDYAEFVFAPDTLPSDGYREIYLAMEADVKDCGCVRASAMFSGLSEEARQLLPEIIDYEFLSGDGKDKYDDCVRTLEIASIEKRIAYLRGESTATPAERRAPILKELSMLTKKLGELRTESPR